MYWILFLPLLSLASNRNPLWLALFVGPLGLAAYGWFLCGTRGRAPERGAFATLGLLDLGIIGIVAAQKGLAGEVDGGVIRAGVGLATVLWLTFGLPAPRFGLPARGKHARRLIALIAMALVVSAGVDWLGALIPTFSKNGTPALFWPLFLTPLPFYLTPLWSVLSEGWRVHKTPPRLPGLTELWELPAAGDPRPLADRERLIRAVLQAEGDVYRILLSRREDALAATSSLRAAEEALVRAGTPPPSDNRVAKWATDRLLQLADRADPRNTAPNSSLLLREALDDLPPENRRVLSQWLVAGESFAELLACSGLSSHALREEIRSGLALLTEAADLRLHGVETPVLALYEVDAASGHARGVGPSASREPGA